MNTIQNQIRDLPTHVGQLIPLDPLLPVPGSPDGGFADLLRNFDAEPKPDPQSLRPTTDMPPPPPQPPSAVNQQRPGRVAIKQTEGANADTVADAGKPDTDPGPGGPCTVEEPVRANGALADETCTLPVQLDPEGGLSGADPTTPGKRGRTPLTERTKASAAAVDTQAPTDPGAAASLLQAQKAHVPVEIRPDAKTLSDTSRSAVGDALARASDRAQGQQQADRQAQVQATQAAPLDSASAPTAAIQSFAKELQNNLPMAGVPRAGTPGISGVGSAGSLAAAAATSEEAPAAPTSVAMPEPLDDAGFASALGARLAILAKDGVQKAELHLNPSDMGPVAVQITVDGQQAQVTFHAAQADTRGVLEQGLPDLAAALAANGLTLSGGGVFQQQQGREGQSEGSNASGDRRSAGGQAVDATSTLPQGMPVGTRQRGVVDLYA